MNSQAGQIKSRNTITFRMVAWILLFSTLISALLTAGQLIFDFFQEKRLTTEKIDAIGALSSPTLANALWALDTDSVNAQLQAIVALPNVEYAAITEATGQTSHFAGNYSPDTQFSRQFTLSHQIQNDADLPPEYNLGKLEIAPDSGLIYEHTLKKGGMVLLAQFAKTLLVTSFMFFLFYRQIIQHLQHMAHYLNLRKTEDPDALDPPMMLRRPHREDELQVLADSINNHKSRLSKAFIKLKDKTKQLNQEVTEQHTSESQLRKQHKIIHNIFDSINDYVVAIKEDGSITHINHACLHLFQPLEENQIIGENINRLCEFRFTRSNKADIFQLTSFVEKLKNTEVSGFCYVQNSISLPVTIKITAQFELESQHYHTLIITDESNSMKLEEVSFRASHDYLTGVENRLSFEHELEDILTSERVITQQYTACMINIDNFKMINTLYGHLRGDLVLKQIAQKIRECVRETDMAARLAGDEFGVIFNEGYEECLVPCKRIQKALAEIEIELDKPDDESSKDSTSEPVISASFGLTPIYAGDTLNAIFSRTDKACFMAKEDGGGTIKHMLIDPDELDDRSVFNDKIVITDIKEMLNSENILLFSQPIVRLADHHTVDHVEILLRMIDHDNGKETIRSPYSYLQVAEKYNLTHMLDRRMLELLTRHLIEDNIEERNINLNLSVKSILHPIVQTKIYELLFLARRLKKRIYIEITETSLIKRLDDIRQFLHESKLKGAHYVVDDFGQGFASYGTLQKLPIDMIKIDGSLVEQVLNDEKVRAVIASIHSVAQSQDALTVAEHIPDEASLNMLREMGIDYGQAFILGEPYPIMKDGSETTFLPSSLLSDTAENTEQR